MPADRAVVASDAPLIAPSLNLVGYQTAPTCVATVPVLKASRLCCLRLQCDCGIERWSLRSDVSFPFVLRMKVESLTPRCTCVVDERSTKLHLDQNEVIVRIREAAIVARNPEFVTQGGHDGSRCRDRRLAAGTWRSGDGGRRAFCGRTGAALCKVRVGSGTQELFVPEHVGNREQGGGCPPQKFDLEL